MQGEVPCGGGNACAPAQRRQRQGFGGAVSEGAAVQRHQQLRHKPLAQHLKVLLALKHGVLPPTAGEPSWLIDGGVFPGAF